MKRHISAFGRQAARDYMLSAIDSRTNTTFLEGRDTVPLETNDLFNFDAYEKTFDSNDDGSKYEEDDRFNSLNNEESQNLDPMSSSEFEQKNPIEITIQKLQVHVSNITEDLRQVKEENLKLSNTNAELSYRLDNLQKSFDNMIRRENEWRTSMGMRVVPRSCPSMNSFCVEKVKCWNSTAVEYELKTVNSLGEKPATKVITVSFAKLCKVLRLDGLPLAEAVKKLGMKIIGFDKFWMYSVNAFPHKYLPLPNGLISDITLVGYIGCGGDSANPDEDTLHVLSTNLGLKYKDKINRLRQLRSRVSTQHGEKNKSNDVQRNPTSDSSDEYET